MTLEQWFRSRFTKQNIDPRRPGGLGWKHYLGSLSVAAVIGAVFQVLIWLGILFGTVYGATWFRQHYHVGIPIPAKHQKVPVPSGHAPPNGSSLRLAFLPSAHNQGSANSCEAFLFNKQTVFQWQKNHPGKHVWYSPWWFYAWAGHGANVPTTAGGYNKILRLHGAIPSKSYPAPASPTASHLRKPQLRFARYAVPLSENRHWLWRNLGAGYGAVVLGQRSINSGHLIGLNLEVDSSFYTTAGVDGWYDPAINAAGNLAGGTLFGHGVVCFRYSNSHRFPNGDAGGFFCQNSWSGRFGVNCKTGARLSGTGNGCFWLAYRTIESVSYEADYQTYNAHPAGTVAGPRAGWTPVPAPKLGQEAPLPSAGYGTIYVHGVVTHDTGVDISNAINQACAYYHIGWDCSVGLVALFGVESNIQQYAPHSPIGAWDVCDWSGGLAQINVCTAASYGVGNGSATQANIDAVFNYEQADPVRMVWLAAKAVADFHAHVCWGWYELYSSWNMGDGYGCYATVYEYPNNGITIQAVASFKQWYSAAWTEYGTFIKPGGPPAPPKPVPAKAPAKPVFRLTKHQAHVWDEYRHEHKLPGISPWLGPHKPKWAARAWSHVPISKIGGVVKQRRWYKGKRRGFMKWSLQGGSIYLHPYDGKSNVRFHKWKR